MRNYDSIIDFLVVTYNIDGRQRRKIYFNENVLIQDIENLIYEKGLQLRLKFGKWGADYTKIIKRANKILNTSKDACPISLSVSGNFSQGRDVCRILCKEFKGEVYYIITPEGSKQYKERDICVILDESYNITNIFKSLPGIETTVSDAFYKDLVSIVEESKIYSLRPGVVRYMIRAFDPPVLGDADLNSASGKLREV